MTEDRERVDMRQHDKHPYATYVPSNDEAVENYELHDTSRYFSADEAGDDYRELYQKEDSSYMPSANLYELDQDIADRTMQNALDRTRALPYASQVPISYSDEELQNPLCEELDSYPDTGYETEQNVDRKDYRGPDDNSQRSCTLHTLKPAVYTSMDEVPGPD